MKIGIITQPLRINYGGILQNYALQQVLKNLGHNVTTLNREYQTKWYHKIKNNIKRFIKKWSGKDYSPSPNELSTINQHCNNFINKYITTTKKIYTQKELKNIINTQQFDAYIAGSDQIWRPCYSPYIYNDFLDFCQNKKDIKRIAYAASFGVSNWEFTETETKKCAHLAKLFDAVSVREESGITLCKKYLNIEAEQVLDPTLLLTKEEYELLVKKENCEELSPGHLFCYILDSNNDKTNVIKTIENKQHYVSYTIKAPKEGSMNLKSDLTEYIVPSPIKWLRAFMDAKMIFTDSFHGCVFSIIFNKPFWVIENKERGNARFDSLLKIFHLENRRIDINELHKIDFSSPIDWEEINSIKEEWQKKSISFLKNSIL